MDLDKIKKEYSLIEKKYKLPGFSEINQIFEIEKLDYETECLARVVRKMMMDKIVNSLGFFDMLLNPVNAPRIYLQYIKIMNNEDKKLIDEIYNEFGQISLDCMPLEVEYSEKSEAEMINKIFAMWTANKGKFGVLLKKVANPGTEKFAKKERSYFG